MDQSTIVSRLQDLRRRVETMTFSEEEKPRGFLSSVMSTAAAAFLGAANGAYLERKYRVLPTGQQAKLAQTVLLRLFDLADDVLGADVTCRDCGYYGHGYMLHDDVWHRALSEEERAYEQAGGSVIICLWCMDKRLPHMLSVDDLDKDKPINAPALFFHGYEHPERRQRRDQQEEVAAEPSDDDIPF